MLRRKASKLLRLIVYGTVVLALFKLYNSNFLHTNTAFSPRVEKDGKAEDVPQFVVVLCQAESAVAPKKNQKGGKDNRASSIQRQLRQISVLLKSAATLTSTTLRFHLVTDSEATHALITGLTEDWPPALRLRLQFSPFTPAVYPNGTSQMQNMFLICATERLFLPWALKGLDAVVFLDTDTLFLQPPEHLWQQLHRFQSHHVLGSAPCMYMYGPKFRKFPTYGRSGINAGVLLLNLTRMLHFQAVEELEGPEWRHKLKDQRQRKGHVKAQVKVQEDDKDQVKEQGKVLEQPPVMTDSQNVGDGDTGRGGDSDGGDEHSSDIHSDNITTGTELGHNGDGRMTEDGAGWVSTVVRVTQQYAGKLGLADQDILNIIFSQERGQLLYELGCEWNYRQKMCSVGRQRCRGATNHGVALLHGASMTFVNGREKKLQAVFEAWEEYPPGAPLDVLLQLVQDKLQRHKDSPGCSRIKGVNIDHVILKGLRRTVRQLQLVNATATRVETRTAGSWVAKWLNALLLHIR